MPSVPKLKKLTIDRALWLHGEGHDVSRLLRETDGKMCCLGFLALACGAKRRDILDEASPQYAKEVKWPSGLLDADGDADGTLKLMQDNDDEHLRSDSRERKIRSGLKKLGFEVLFVGRKSRT
jgi:hypothetical protein